MRSHLHPGINGHLLRRHTFKICGRFCSCPTDHTFLRQRRKTLGRDHVEQILNTSNVENITPSCARNESLLRDVQK